MVMSKFKAVLLKVLYFNRVYLWSVHYNFYHVTPYVKDQKPSGGKLQKERNEKACLGQASTFDKYMKKV